MTSRIKKYFRPIPKWYKPIEEKNVNPNKYSLNAITQRPPHMYHSWGSQNAWLRQITNRNYLYISEFIAKKNKLKNNDWVWIESSHNKIKVQCRIMKGVNKFTVWTWNAIGKRKGAWNLDPQSPETEKSFLLNHIIPDLLPKKEDGYNYSNSDPITGQAAWYDLKVDIYKCKEKDIDGKTYPSFKTFKNKSRKNIKINTYGKEITKNYSANQSNEHFEYIGNKKNY